MDDKSFKRRILNTKFDIYPLDRLLPLESVYSFFQTEYVKSEDKNLFFRDRKFQRLREGYFSIFIAISLQDISNKVHYLVFPSKPDNDVYITYSINLDIDKLGTYEFDIKEFTNWSSTFEEFTRKSIIPKINIYNIAIPTYRKIEERDIEPLINHLSSKDLTTQIWFIDAPTDEDQDSDISYVTIVSKEGILYNKIINVNDWIDKTKPITIFQDIIRFK